MSTAMETPQQSRSEKREARKQQRAHDRQNREPLAKRRSAQIAGAGLVGLAVGGVLGGIGMHEYDDEGKQFLWFDGTKASCEATINGRNTHVLGTFVLSHEQIEQWKNMKSSPLIDGTLPDPTHSTSSDFNATGIPKIMDAIEGSEVRWVEVRGQVDMDDRTSDERIARDAAAASRLIEGWNTNPNAMFTNPGGLPVRNVTPNAAVQIQVVEPFCTTE